MQRIDRPWGGRKSLGLFPCLPGLVCQSCGLRRDPRSPAFPTARRCLPPPGDLCRFPLLTLLGSSWLRGETEACGGQGLCRARRFSQTLPEPSQGPGRKDFEDYSLTDEEPEAC